MCAAYRTHNIIYSPGKIIVTAEYGYGVPGKVLLLICSSNKAIIEISNFEDMLCVVVNIFGSPLKIGDAWGRNAFFIQSSASLSPAMGPSQMSRGDRDLNFC